MAKKRFRRLTALVVLGSVAVLTGCKDDAGKKPAGGSAAAEGGSSGGGGGRTRSRNFPVMTAPVESRLVTYEIEAVGDLVEENRFEIPSKAAGVAELVNFTEGDEVTTGQELLRVDYERYALQLEQARSVVAERTAAVARAEAQLADAQRETSTALQTAQLNLELAQSEFQRRAASGSSAFTSPEERAQFENKFRQAENAYRDSALAARTQTALAQAEVNAQKSALATEQAKLAVAQDDLARSIIRAPIAGTIQRRSVVEGQYLDPGDTVALMVQSNPLRLRFEIPESRAARLQTDMRVKFEVPAYRTRQFEANLYDIGVFADPQTREVTCWARVENTANELKPGYFAHVSIVTESREAAVVVPLTSVYPTERGNVVYVVQDGVAERRPVVTGLNVTGDAVEIVSGLRHGEQLVVEGGASLQHGVPVTVVPGTMQGGAGTVETSRPAQKVAEGSDRPGASARTTTSQQQVSVGG